MRTAEKYKLLNKAISPLQKYDNYFGKFDEVEVKETLIEFFKVLQGIAPDKKLNVTEFSYYSAYSYLLNVRRALTDGRYANACNEILTLNHFEPILQNRIYVGLIRLYHEFLE